MVLSSGLGGWRGLLGLLVIAVAVGMAYGSLVGTVVSQWVPTAGGITGILVLGAAASMLILVWLLGAVVR